MNWKWKKELYFQAKALEIRKFIYPYVKESIRMQILSPGVNQSSRVRKINSVVPNINKTAT